MLMPTYILSFLTVELVSMTGLSYPTPRLSPQSTDDCNWKLYLKFKKIGTKVT